MTDKEFTLVIGPWTLRRTVGWRLALVLGVLLTCGVCCGAA